MYRKICLSLAGLGLAVGLQSYAFADDSSYKPGTVWEFSTIKTEPGQFENYLDWLDDKWKKEQELMKKEGYVVSYHVLNVNNSREGEGDLILAVEYKDYMTNAQREAIQKKVEAMFAADTHKMETQSGDRKVMRKLAGSMELQELNLK